MPLLTPPPSGGAARGGPRVLAAVALAVVLALAVAAAWSALRPDSYAQSRAGCVSVTVPSTTGGALLHGCGRQARAMCRQAFRHDDRLSLLIRPSCRQAGLG